MTTHADSNIIPFPARGRTYLPPPETPEPPARPPRLQRDARRDMRLNEIADRLGIGHQSVGTIVAKLRGLAAHEGMPLPRTIRMLRGRELRGVRQIVPGALWDRYLMECWFDNRLAVPQRAAVQRHEQEQRRSDMAERARRLAGLDGAA